MSLRKVLEKNSIFDKDPDYLVREVTKGNYQVTKWTKGKEPKEIYDIKHFEKTNKWTCNCPTKIKPCKHIGMVRDWIKMGKKIPFNTKENEKWFKNLK